MELQFDLKIDLSPITDKLSPANHKRAMFYMLEGQVLADMNNYVPLEEDSLRMSGHVDDHETLVWDTPYALAQFVGVIHGGTVHNYTTPGTGPYWDEVAKGNHMDDWTNAYLKGAGLS